MNPVPPARPLVSVLIPCRNEQAHIAGCLRSVLTCGYPQECLEILVIDGMSTDATPAVVRALAVEHPCVHLLLNPARITPAGLNLGLRAAAGQFIMRMDAHALVAPGYIDRCLAAIREFDADNVGGPMQTAPQSPTLTGRAIALTLSHPFGVGNSRFRIGSSRPIEVDTVFGGFYPRHVFSRIGGFNPRLVRGQDLEFNLRLRRAGGRILLVPGVTSRYFARSTVSGFLEQNWTNGRWTVLAWRFSDSLPVRLRHLLPGAVVALGATLLALAPFSPAARFLLLAACGVYAALALAGSLSAARRGGDARLLLVLPFLFPALHLSYGAGSVLELLRAVAPWSNNRFVRFSHAGMPH